MKLLSVLVVTRPSKLFLTMNVEASPTASDVRGGRLSSLVRIPRFSFASLLVLVTALSVAAGVLLQHQRLGATQAAVTRYESEQISTPIPTGTFHVIARTGIDLDHVKVATYRVECGDAVYRELMGGSGGGSGMSSGCNEVAEADSASAAIADVLVPPPGHTKFDARPFKSSVSI